MDNRPVGRKKNVTGGGTGVSKRGSGIGGSPVGGSSSHKPTGSSGGGPERSGSRGRMPLIIVILVLLLGGGGGLSALFGGGSSSDYTDTDTIAPQSTQVSQSTASDQGTGSLSSSILGSLLGSYGSYQGASSGANAAWSGDANTGRLNTEVDPAARDKRTVIKGGGEDIVTIMVYMCGADLESKNGMATRDIQEMMAADLGENVSLILYTGGAKTWQNNVISSQTNQIYQIKDGKLNLLQDNLGSVAMTKPETLSGFINWSAKNFPANRNILIFWDHGGGSTGGYGYDEKFSSAGSMSLSGINSALKNGGVTFDFVGFDTCLMATVENALVVSNYADYLVASEETEPGVGWYYTDWLSAFGKDTSTDTIQIAKIIIDSFTDVCAKNCPGQKTTLSLIDLCELSETVPENLADFSKSISGMMDTSDFKTVSNARSSSREFASAKIDQIDLVDLANRVGTDEAKELSEALLSSIKYNRTGSNMTNAYGLSIYFPYKQSSKVDSMVNTYEDIGMDEEYTRLIQSYAGMGVAGQVASGGTQTPVTSIFGGASGSSGGNSAEVIAQLLTSFLSSDFSSVSGLNASNTEFLGKGLDVDKAAAYIAENQLDTTAFMWTTNAEGQDCITLSSDQWELVEDLELNMFYDDGEGYINLGLDNVFDFDEEGNLLSQIDKTWISIDGRPVSYYVVDIQGTSDSYAITGRVPCVLNGELCNLILVFDSENEDGYVAGAYYDYVDGQTEVLPKNLTEIKEGDEIDFICEYYGYDMEFQDNYEMGPDTYIVPGDMSDILISNTYVGDGDVLIAYRITDIYGQNFWTDSIRY